MRKLTEDAKRLYVLRHGYGFPNQGISELILDNLKIIQTFEEKYINEMARLVVTILHTSKPCKTN